MEAAPTIRLRIWALFYIVLSIVETAEAQAPGPPAPRNATIDPSEARAINSIFRQWGITARAGWNISGELCSGTAIDDTTLDFSPGIQCDCSYNNRTTCHVTNLRVYSMSDWDASSNVVGPLPDELWNLTYLTSLNLAQNYLTGPIPPSISNLTRMQYLSLGINALSGELPRELGQLTDLISLAVGTNNFTGVLPSELGNCQRLREFYFDSSGVSGAIPSTFANLRSLEIVFASDNDLTGRIPNFIGSWSQLTSLRISGLSNGSSSLDFLANMMSLTTLVLRNNSISGSIPSNFNEYPGLSLLDMSFNNLNGQIPDSLFNLSSLVHLFLGNNSLNGSLPSQKADLLQFIDLSYNELSGSFPSWVNQPNLQINLVANNFIIEGSNSRCCSRVGIELSSTKFSLLPRRPPIFAIKCGGPQMRSATGIVHEADNETLGPAAYYVTRERRWAVSNVGLPSGSRNPQYTTNYVTFIPNIRDPELFQEARISAGSLRYYGLGLENGNYTVSLQFVETTIPNPPVWQSLGRRIFDIYIQGNLALRDFDIRREAGGASFRAVVREFTAPVRENHLEIHLVWAGKGTCCVPNQGTYGPSISAISVAPADFIPTVSNNAPNDSANDNNRTGLIVGIVSGFSFGEEKDRRTMKGTLVDGRDVAVKQLSVASHQGKSQFVAEIATISAVQHRNLVKLYGCCIEGDKRLIAWRCHENKQDIKLLDANITEFDEDEVRRVIYVSLLCSQTSPAQRPSMSRVVAMLSGDIEVPTVTSKPGYLTEWNFNDMSTFVDNRMAAPPSQRPSPLLLLFCVVVAFAVLFDTVRAQNRNTTNPFEELCSGAATDDAIQINDLNPGIKCDCSQNSTCHITALRVYALDVAGSLPDELWNLTYLTNLDLRQNYLTGPLPASIGNLNRLQYLSFGTNNFSGPLPRELGNILGLEQLYIDSAGVSGPIPTTFANLRSLQTVWASDNELTGQIPDFIGNWSSLVALRFEGNSFQGPIPPSLSGLTSMNDLRISDLSNGTSSLDFLRNMASLSTLVLRNNNISGSIPSYLGQLRSLTLLDMSFNNLTGGIPDALFNLSSLTHLFLGNNMLIGALPSAKSGNLLNIDLSYNELSGSFPAWIRAQNLQLILPSGLNCLQRNFQCNRDSPIYSRFAVKCGGPQITSSNRIVYETDDATLGRWAVSNVGLPSSSNSPQYRWSSSSQFTNTLDSELFQTARISAGSLRYYGLGLENGNYTVRLQFAETAIQSTRSWRSVGRRVFDIYIQGNRERQDFDIQREAGGVSFRAVEMSFSAQVLNNYLEIHLFWAGKGTCCVPTQGTYGPLISAISATPDFVTTVGDNPPGSSRSRTGLIVGYVMCSRKGKGRENLRMMGTLGDGRVVAVKQLSVASHQGKSQFVAEIATISAVQHRNLVKLYGCCIEGARRLLVYEYLVNKSLDQLLFGIGYLAPEYAMRGHLTEKADIFSFGVVALEIISGRPNSDSTLEDDKIYLLEWAWNLHENNKDIELLDPTLSNFDENEVKRIIAAGLLCTQASPALRPPMSRVVAMLSGDIEVASVTSRPGYLTDWKFSDATTFVTNTESSNSNINDSYMNADYSTSTTMVSDSNNSPVNPARPILHEVIGEGR
ncbi:hypothetical protein ACJIZ3_006823 [Penstemon smallii]|uniref:non-specific serine/threonine protein kinase n=1 Tax=Penstemon smallii TaxID=265156 RepID=A0ABD3S9A7_9LAMI